MSMRVWPCLLSIVALACDPAVSVGEVPAASIDATALAALEAQPSRVGPLVLAHGGQGSPAARSDGPARAVELGFAALALAPDDGVAAALSTVEVLEDDPRFNAGTGANLRIDGSSIEADAAIMDDAGHFGAVAGISGVRHPVRVAQAVLGSPHLLLVGEGAQLFAQTLGLEAAELSTPQARAKLRRGYARLFAPTGTWADYDWRARWNFPAPPPADLDDALARLDAQVGAEARETDATPDATKDTVGVVLRTAAGRYVAALSTGGTTLAMHGRVGDVPMLGAGLYAGPEGAVAATGKGEAIIRERVAARVYELLAAGHTPNDAITLVMRDISAAEGVGVIAVSERGWGTGASSQMAWAVRDGSGLAQADRWVQRWDR